MFLNGLSKGYYMRDGSQRARGFFLVLMCLPDLIQKESGIRGLVRSVELQQCGHFMMGTLRLTIKGTIYKVPLSGAYGADGLIREVCQQVFDIGTPLPPLPPELREKWNIGGGHNSVGSEAPAMDEWARTLVYPVSTLHGNRRKKTG